MTETDKVGALIMLIFKWGRQKIFKNIFKVCYKIYNKTFKGDKMESIPIPSGVGEKQGIMGGGGELSAFSLFRDHISCRKLPCPMYPFFKGAPLPKTDEDRDVKVQPFHLNVR